MASKGATSGDKNWPCLSGGKAMRKSLVYTQCELLENQKMTSRLIGLTSNTRGVGIKNL